MESRTEAEKEQRAKKISIWMSVIIGLIVLYFAAYMLSSDEEGVALGVYGMARGLASGQFFFPISFRVLWSVPVAVIIGLVIYLFNWTDFKKKEHYEDEAIAGTGGFMTEKEMKEYADNYILPDPPVLDKNLPIPFDPENDKKMYSGNMILSENFCRPIESRKLIGNSNVLIVGGAGSGKTRFIIKPNLLQMNASYVITDPSGEIIHSLGQVMKDHGYKIKIFNISDMAHSNCYNPLEYIRDDSGVRMVIDCLINNTQKGQAGGDNQFFVDAEKLLYSACIYYLKDFGTNAGYKNFAGVMKMINASSVNEMDPKAKSPLDKLFDTLPADSLARQNYTAFKQAAGKTLKSIIISCVTRLQPFLIPQVANLTKKDELHLEKLGEEKTAIFIITPQADRTYAFLASMLYSQLFETLYFIGEKRKAEVNDERLPVPVRCMMDEFANIGEVPEFPSKLATMRKYNISATVVLQGISQIESMYDKDWKSIVDNSSTICFLGGQEVDTLKYFSEKLGKKTIRTKSSNISAGAKGSSSEGYQNTGREVMTPEELGRMPTDKCVIFTQNTRAVYDTKYKYETHPYYPQTADANEENAFKYATMSIYDTNKSGNADSLLKAQSEGARYRDDKEAIEKRFRKTDDVMIETDGNPLDNITLGWKRDDMEFKKKVEEGTLKSLEQRGTVCILNVSGIAPKDLPKYISVVSLRAKKPALLVIDDTSVGEDYIICGIAVDTNHIGLEKALNTQYTRQVEKAGDFYVFSLSKYKVDDFTEEVLENSKRLIKPKQKVASGN